MLHNNVGTPDKWCNAQLSVEKQGAATLNSELRTPTLEV